MGIGTLLASSGERPDTLVSARTVIVSFIAQTLTTRPSSVWSEHPRSAMTSPSIAFCPVSKICAQVKHLGYAVARRIRLYGEEFEVVSDPFPEADGVAVHVTTKKDPSIRVLRIPMTVLQSAKRAAATALAAIRVERTIVEQGEKSSTDKSKDQDRGKGATEQTPQREGEGGNTSMQGQLGHGDENAELKEADSNLSG
jgi:hypothetical protein